MSSYYHSILNTLTVPFTNTKSILLDGVDDYVDCGNPTSFQFTGAMTVSAWIKTTDTSDYEIIVGKDKQTPTLQRSFLLYRLNSNARFAIFAVNGRLAVTITVTGTSTINDGNWHHVMGVNTGSDLKIYVDGVLEATEAGYEGTMIGGDSINVNIGRRATTASADRGYWTGNIDEVAMWNSDQSANASAIGGTIPTDLATYSPLAWWRCGDGDTAPTLIDHGSAAKNGTMENFSTFSTDVPT